MVIKNELSIKNESMVEDVMADAETEEALAEFDFLVSESGEGAGEARSQGDGTDWGKKKDLPTSILTFYVRFYFFIFIFLFLHVHFY